MTNELFCFRWGASIAVLPLPLARLAACPACRADVHVCRMCEFYDPRVSKACREPVAEEVKDKEHADFCGYFQARPGAYRPPEVTEAQAARARLEALSGLGREEDRGGASGTPTTGSGADTATEPARGRGAA